MITYIVQIGNSDNKLPQAIWAQFINELADILAKFQARIHFFGHSAPQAPWQNCCAVFDDPLERDELVSQALLEVTFADLAWRYDQDSIALTIGSTQFIEAHS